MLTIYSDQNTARLSYTFEVLFEDLLDCPIRITQDISALGKGPSLNYSHQEIADVPYIRPHSLLFETGTRNLGASFDDHGNLFPTESDIANQDLFAASFFLLSRYEEYLNPELDEFGRVKASSSLLYQAGLLENVVVDQWIISCYNELRKKHPLLPASNRSFQVVPTFDIDVAYAYKGRSWYRRTRSSLKDIVSFNIKRLKDRRLVLKGEKPDNYDSYSYQERICQQAGVQSRHFFLLGNYGKHDKNLAHNQEILRMLIKHTSQWSQVGIHPSMGSNSSMRQLKKEITRLKNITGHEVTKSRQHYLMLSLPETYQALISQRIEEDYTMGYADHIGFRAGTCSPFPWYDISKEQGTSLYLFPTAVMDSTLKDYMGLSIEESIVQMKKLRKTVEAVRGKFVILWHNHSAARQGEWVGWRQVLEAGLFN